MIFTMTAWLALACQAPDSWRFVAPAPGEPFESPPLRALVLSDSRPDDLVERVSFRGVRRRYAQVRYGSLGSVRVSVVVDELGPGRADLYVDADRNRRIEERDRLDGDGPTWRAAVPAEFVERTDTVRVPREVLFRLGSTGRTLAAAAVGYWEGAVRLGDQVRRARRTDADLDGSFAGPQDRLWIDRDDDGRWDPIGEQYLFAPTLNLPEGRSLVAADSRGERLELRALEGTGSVRLAIAQEDVRKAITGIHASMVGKDGSVIGIHSADAVVEAPIGAYRLTAVVATLRDPSGVWSFVFSDMNGSRPPTWHEVQRDKTLEIDPIGRLDLAIDLPDDLAPPSITVQPRLFTGEGLLINSGTRGDGPGDRPVTTARVSVLDERGETLDATTSGFS